MSLVDERGPLQLVHATSVEPAYIELLSSTRFGTDSLRYRRRGVADALDRLPPTDFYTLHEGEQLIGGYALTPTEITFADRTLNTLYRHSLVIDERYQGQGLGRWLVDVSLTHRTRDTGIDFSFGSIETGNRRSSAIVRDASALSLGTLRSELLYRQWTRRSDRVTVNPDEVLVQESLDLSESDCLYRFTSRRDAPFYAVIEDGRILAGASARLNSLDLLSPGVSPGRLYSAMVRLLPPARRRFDPADFRFVTLSDTVIDRDGRRAWKLLVSHVMREFGVHMANVTLDPRRATYKSLQQQGLLGRFSRATREEFSLVARPHSMSVVETPNKPTGLAPLDL